MSSTLKLKTFLSSMAMLLTAGPAMAATVAVNPGNIQATIDSGTLNDGDVLELATGNYNNILSPANILTFRAAAGANPVIQNTFTIKANPGKNVDGTVVENLSFGTVNGRLEIDAANNVVVQNNTFDRGFQSGNGMIRVLNTTSGVQILNNELSHNSQTVFSGEVAISLVGPTSNLVVQGNNSNFTHNFLDVGNQSLTNVVVDNNTHTNSPGGNFINGSSATYNEWRITNNNINGTNDQNNRPAINLNATSSSDNLFIGSNTFVGGPLGESAGLIELDGGGQTIYVRDNTFSIAAGDSSTNSMGFVIQNAGFNSGELEFVGNEFTGESGAGGKFNVGVRVNQAAGLDAIVTGNTYQDMGNGTFQTMNGVGKVDSKSNNFLAGTTTAHAISGSSASTDPPSDMRFNYFDPAITGNALYGPASEAPFQIRGSEALVPYDFSNIAPNGTWFDVNGDGVSDAADIAVAQAVLDLGNGTERLYTFSEGDITGDGYVTLADVPEPASLALLGLGGLLMLRRRAA